MSEDGSFALDHLLPGTYTLRLWASGERRIVTRADVRVGAAGGDGVVLRWGE